MASKNTTNQSDAEDDNLFSGSTEVEEELTSTDECSSSIDALKVSQEGRVDVPKNETGTGAATSFDKKPDSDFTKPQLKILVPTQFRVLSWNIDGLHDNLRLRTEATLNIIESEKPDIVFLQEVVPITLNYMKERMSLYETIASDSEDYFCVIMIRKRTVSFDGHNLIEFENSTMMRNLLIVDAHIGACKLRLMTSHLESREREGEERMEQLKILLKEITTAPSELNCIFGGDTNLRDHEVESVGGLPDCISDIWEITGSNPKTKYTWDLTKNHNLTTQGTARFRFDRMFLRRASKLSSAKKRVEANQFRLVGLQKIGNTRKFPSDHWGCLAHFHVVDCV